MYGSAIYFSDLLLQGEILFAYMDADRVEHLLFAMTLSPGLGKDHACRHQRHRGQQTCGPHPPGIGRNQRARCLIAQVEAHLSGSASVYKDRTSEQAGQNQKVKDAKAHRQKDA